MVYANGERIVLAKYSQALGTAINALAGHTPDPGADVSLALADEARAERLWDDDRRLFVCNLGWLLSQTRCGVVSCELYGDHDREYVTRCTTTGRQAGDDSHCGQLIWRLSRT